MWRLTLEQHSMTHNFTTLPFFRHKTTEKRVRKQKQDCKSQLVGFLSFSVHGVSSRTEITVFLHVVRTTISSLPTDSSIFRRWPLISALDIVNVLLRLEHTLISLTDYNLRTFDSSSLTSNSVRNSLLKERKYWKLRLVKLLKLDEALPGLVILRQSKSFVKQTLCIAYYKTSKAYIFVGWTIN